MEHVDAYPLQWPPGRPRTRYPASSQFGKRSYAMAAYEVQREIELLGGKSIVISTNLRLRQDGLPLASQRMPTDHGVAVYFTYKGRQTCFACDRWDRVEHNIRAIFKTIEALRGITRWGSGDMMDAAFSGFTALPAPIQLGADRPWWEVLDVEEDSPHEIVETAYRFERSNQHPDKGGDPVKFNAVQRAWDEYQQQAQRGRP